MSHNTIQNWFRTIWGLNYNYKYSITELENMYPFERDIYIDLCNEDAEKKQNAAGGDQPGGLFDMDGSYVGPATG